MVKIYLTLNRNPNPNPDRVGILSEFYRNFIAIMIDMNEDVLSY